ncbi:MAG TPA: hypothetical protein VGD40_14720 [Chryseosolibacter sp.]
MRYFVIIGMVLRAYAGLAQDSLEHKLQVKGYVKDLQALNFQENFSNLVTGNLIHHRVNLRWQPVKAVSTAVEVRNRFFWGEEIVTIPAFSRQLTMNNGLLDLSWNALDKQRMIFNTTIDRLWIEYTREKWNLRAGRQRINWGIGTTWNPNDIFNTFNFLDFDYEERPGIDGIKFQYYTRAMDHVETAIAFSQRAEDIVGAVRYFKNIANYDLQLLAGFFHKQPTLGFGWSGSIKETGFKGELQYFLKRGPAGQQLNTVIEADHVFSKGWYLNLAAFYNSAGVKSSAEIPALINFQFTPRNLMPTEWNCSLSFSKEISPLIAVNVTFIYSPGTNLVLALPGLAYSATENLDINLVWQSFFIDQQSGFDDLSHRCFLRFKWSY